MKITMAKVQFKDTYKEYVFKTHLTDLERGDKVVVDTQYGLQVATFKRYTSSAYGTPNSTKWIIQKVDDLGEQRKQLIRDRISELVDDIEELGNLRRAKEKEIRELSNELD